MRMTASKITQIMPPIVEKLERLLTQWIEHQHQCVIPLSTMIIQAKAKSLFENLNDIEPDLKVQSFAISAGWIEHFKGFHGIHNLKQIGKAAAANLVPAEKFPAVSNRQLKGIDIFPSKCSVWMRLGFSGAL
jgi:hypothetical protein